MKGLGMVVLFSLLMSCSGQKPNILGLRWRILYHDDGNNRFEEMAVMIRAEDKDGFDDLALLSITPPISHLVWQLEPGTWNQKEQSQWPWIGASQLVLEDRGRFPSGRWTIRVEDLEGKYDEITFQMDGRHPRIDELEWPVPQVEEGGRFTLEGPYPTVFIILFDKEGDPLETYLIKNGDIIPSGGSNPPKTWEIWAPLNNVSQGIRMGPYPWPDPNFPPP